jgi:hypothetical protein
MQQNFTPFIIANITSLISTTNNSVIQTTADLPLLERICRDKCNKQFYHLFGDSLEYDILFRCQQQLQQVLSLLQLRNTPKQTVALAGFTRMPKIRNFTAFG